MIRSIERVDIRYVIIVTADMDSMQRLGDGWLESISKLYDSLRYSLVPLERVS
jgi:hypothetical protein